MATRGFESWTEADVEAHNRKFQGSKVSAEYPNKAGAEPDKGPISLHPSTPGKSTKGHKYRAEPCIVTPDLTLFTKADFDRLDDAQAAQFTASPNAEHLNKTWPLKRRAEHHRILGIWFGSTKEGRRYIELSKLEKAGMIRTLERQVNFWLVVHPDTSIGKFVADFVYEECEPGGMGHSDVWTQVVEDVKGLKTPLYRWKKKHVEAQYGITIFET